MPIIRACGHRMKIISAYEARKLPEGTILIVHRYWQDQKTFKLVREVYYRVKTVYRKTVAGTDVAIQWDPDPEFVDMPPWQNGWIWLEDGFGREFLTIADDHEAMPWDD